MDSIDEQSSVLLRQINRIGDDPLRDLTWVVNSVEKLTSEAINADNEQVGSYIITMM